MKKTKRVYNT
jgi:hypothetical protein